MLCLVYRLTEILLYIFMFSIENRFTPVPDSVLHSALMSGEKMTTLDSRQQVHLVLK